MSVECLTELEVSVWQDRLHHRGQWLLPSAPTPPEPLPEQKPVERLSLAEAHRKLELANIMVRLWRQEQPGMFSSLYRRACQSRQRALDAYRVALALDDTPRQQHLL